MLTPVDSNPETAAITILKFAESPSASAHMIREDEWQEMKKVWDANPEDVRAARYRKIQDVASVRPRRTTARRPRTGSDISYWSHPDDHVRGLGGQGAMEAFQRMDQEMRLPP